MSRWLKKYSFSLHCNILSQTGIGLQGNGYISLHSLSRSTTIIRWTALKFCTVSHGPQRRKPNIAGDPLTFPLVSLWVERFEKHFLTTFGSIEKQFVTNSHGAQRTNPKDFGDFLTFPLRHSSGYYWILMFPCSPQDELL